MTLYKYTHESTCAFLTILAEDIKEANKEKKHLTANPEMWIYRGTYKQVGA